ncbi:hypothetical protein SOCE26_094180 [Sorangium cellulosum]|uniref:Uncharacterized protein n=2 Tax=Sorangium cellulosum TaxID=56 RepID=A0A2L0F8P9_SORCE|nr:hypothetical protein SOCE26_094180 [Sorangium cellulosum]
MLGSGVRATAIALVALLAVGCKKKEKEAPIHVPPPQGAASADELTTAIGQARGLNSALAPTSTRWRRVFVLDDKHAVVAGEIETEAIALVTENAGRTWRALRRPREGWSTWSVGQDGTTVLAVGPRVPAVSGARGAAGAQPAIEPPSLLFAPLEATDLLAPSPVVLPAPSRGARPPVDSVPAVLSAESAALIVEAKPRQAILVYAGPPGAAPAPVVTLPPQEQALPIPYGRPPALLSVRGRNLLARAVPAPGKPLEAPRNVAGLVMSPAATAALSATPACDVAGWSIQIVPQPPDRNVLVAVSAAQTAVIKLPAKLAPRAMVGCGADRITVEVISPTHGETTLSTCGLDGACLLAEKPPFRPWLEPHERSIASAPTRAGVAAVMTARTATRWGLYLTHSTDGGKMYEFPRTIGEGQSERGRIELGALLSFGNRLLMLLQADVTGTSRRGWYVTVSEDSGLTWSPP